MKEKGANPSWFTYLLEAARMVSISLNILVSTGLGQKKCIPWSKASLISRSDPVESVNVTTWNKVTTQMKGNSTAQNKVIAQR